MVGGCNLKSPDERSEEHTSELQSHCNLVCRLLLEKKNQLPAVGTEGDAEDIVRVTGEGNTAAAGSRALGRTVPDPQRAVDARRGEPLFFNDTATTEIYTLSLHDALPI